jgi:hypothetical protein
MRRDVLEEFAEAAKLGRRKERFESVIVSEPVDPAPARRREVHSFLASIVTRGRTREESAAKRRWAKFK